MNRKAWLEKAGEVLDIEIDALKGQRDALNEDRKSTRLNSSHT